MPDNPLKQNSRPSHRDKPYLAVPVNSSCEIFSGFGLRLTKLLHGGSPADYLPHQPPGTSGQALNFRIVAFRLRRCSAMMNHLVRKRLRLWLRVVAPVILVAIALSVRAAEVTSQGPPELTKAVDALVVAWNKQDAELIVGYFLPDAVLIMPTGKTARTRNGIRERLLDESNGKLKDTVLKHTIETVSLDSNDTATIEGKYRVQGVKVMGQEKSPEGGFVFTHKKEQGRWFIAKAELLRENSN